jgi:hypothetical protein
MATFDQRGQNVNYQYNAAGNINFGSIVSDADVVAEFKKLLDEVKKAISVGAIDAENGVDVEAKVSKAIIQAENPKPDKQSILENIEGAKKIIEGIASATSLVVGFVQAAETVRKFFL